MMDGLIELLRIVGIVLAVTLIITLVILVAALWFMKVVVPLLDWITKNDVI